MRRSNKLTFLYVLMKLGYLLWVKLFFGVEDKKSAVARGIETCKGLAKYLYL